MTQDTKAGVRLESGQPLATPDGHSSSSKVCSPGFLSLPRQHHNIVIKKLLTHIRVILTSRCQLAPLNERFAVSAAQRVVNNGNPFTLATNPGGVVHSSVRGIKQGFNQL
ncbi:hypothetical protein J6590_088216 [Homalodisca vitripennis]|nr:hypothetical protein J6590_088216 [Homalodisca vitripennis]